MGHDKYSKEKKEPYAGLFLYILERRFLLSLIRLLMRKKKLSKIITEECFFKNRKHI